MNSGNLDDAAQEGPGSLLLRFVNTRPIITPKDDLADPASTKQWLIEADLIDPDALVTEADVVAARELRDAIVGVLKSHVGAASDTETAAAQDMLDRAAQAHPLVPHINVDGASFEPSQGGTSGALGAVLADSATVALNDREWARYKACKNPICYRGFRDNSRPGSALYCSHTCASQVGMRAYRARQAVVA